MAIVKIIPTLLSKKNIKQKIMKKIILFLAMSFAICSISFGQTIVKQNEPQKMEKSGGKHKHKKASAGKSKSKYNKLKSKHKHKHMHHHKKHKQKAA